MKKQAMILILFWMGWHTHQSFLFELTQNWGEPKARTNILLTTT